MNTLMCRPHPEGGGSFLTGATARTKSEWAALTALFWQERESQPPQSAVEPDTTPPTPTAVWLR